MSQKIINNIYVLRYLSIIFSNLSRKLKQLIALMTDIVSIILTVWMSFSIKYDKIYQPKSEEILLYVIGILIAIPVLNIYGLYRSVFRFSGFSVVESIAKSCLVYGILYSVSICVLYKNTIPHSITILQPILLLVSVLFSRGLARLLLHPSNKNINKSKIKERILIYGAGTSGIQILSAIQLSTQYSVEGFIDDNKSLYGKIINGIFVYGIDEIPNLIKEKAITSLIIALPDITRQRRKEIYENYKKYGVHIRIFPSIAEIADGKITVSDIREIDIEDILGRDPVQPDQRLYSKCLKDKNILVTGAGGSIGSELCRHIIMQEPDELILLEHSEYNLYLLESELIKIIKTHRKKTKVIALLGDVEDYDYMCKICNKYKIFTIYHAAAYKHVPLVESNVIEGIKNNVFGTLSIAKAAKESNVSYFILISTDKAVRPTNIMGASKRIAEMILQGFANDDNRYITCFSIVRFGNVLGSSGSVVPLFKQQIKNGGPITVTDKNVTRYFMTIPEAVQLVIQAGAMAQGGDVFLLDMGKPVVIMELAKKMIELSGLRIKDKNNPEGDIEIKEVGLRPGEKLYEELLIGDNPIKTEHSRIFKAQEYYLPINILMEKLKILENLILIGDEEEIRRNVKDIICI